MANQSILKTPPRSCDEIERRFLVPAIDAEALPARSHLIEQAYFDKTRDLRVRIVNGRIAVLTRKLGRGRKRREENEPVGLRAARFLHDSTPYVLRKRRYCRNGWEIDVFEGPLKGLVLAEFEMKSEDQVIVIPEWMKNAIEVTETLSNRLLSHVAYDLTCEKMPDRPIREYLPKRVPSIVLTGGPCSGKSTLMGLFRKELGRVLHCVPETATIVIEHVDAKPPLDDAAAMRSFQRVIYRVQHSFEKVSHRQAYRDGKAALLLDRGTVDGAAYMKRGLADLERVCETTVADEYGRYDSVICLGAPPSKAYEANKHNNPARKESYDQAVELGRKIHAAWKGHPRFHFVDGDTWKEKVRQARAAVMECIGRNA